MAKCKALTESAVKGLRGPTSKEGEEKGGEEKAYKRNWKGDGTEAK